MNRERESHLSLHQPQTLIIREALSYIDRSLTATILIRPNITIVKNVSYTQRNLAPALS